MKKPPLLPAEIFRRLLRIARVDGATMLFVAGALALISAFFHDRTGMLVGLLVTSAGAMELHGGTLLQGGRTRGLRWLVASQFYLLAVVLVYVGYQLNHIDISTVKSSLSDDQRQAISDMGLTIEQCLQMVYLLYCSVAFSSLLYQGGMVLYYLRRWSTIVAVIENERS
jgi:hypothetical protein